jgi:hypothetical protein
MHIVHRRGIFSVTLPKQGKNLRLRRGSQNMQPCINTVLRLTQDGGVLRFSDQYARAREIWAALSGNRQANRKWNAARSRE